MTAYPSVRTSSKLTDTGLRAVTATALTVEAGIHPQLATGYQFAAPAGIGQGTLFRIEAAAALLSSVFRT